MGRGLLFLVSGFLIVFGLVQNSVQNRQATLAERSPTYFYQEQTQNAAATMLEASLAKLNGKSRSQIRNIAMNLNNESFDDFGDDNVTGYYKISSSDITNFSSRIVLQAIGEARQADSTIIRSTIKAVLNRDAFSIYSYFTDIEPTIYFATGDVINGPVHTNGTFNMRGEPEFNGKVTSPNDWEDGGNYAEPQFNGGADFSAGHIDFPEEATEAAEQAENGGLKFSDRIRIEFNDDATASITEFRESTKRVCVYFCNSTFFQPRYQTITVIEEHTQDYDLNASGFNGVISSDKNLEVKGILDGEITLHSKGDIRIIGDVRYKNRNFNNPDSEISNDMLGMISEGNTIVDENAHTDHGSSDLDIDATIMTLGESFSVQNYNYGDNRGSLNINGGIIQKRRGPVGTLDGRGNINSGYNKNYTYDERFLDNATEGFPRKERFDLRSWEETTEIINP